MDSKFKKRKNKSKSQRSGECPHLLNSLFQGLNQDKKHPQLEANQPQDKKMLVDMVVSKRRDLDKELLT